MTQKPSKATSTTARARLSVNDTLWIEERPVRAEAGKPADRKFVLAHESAPKQVRNPDPQEDGEGQDGDPFAFDLPGGAPARSEPEAHTPRTVLISTVRAVKGKEGRYKLARVLRDAPVRLATGSVIARAVRSGLLSYASQPVVSTTALGLPLSAPNWARGLKDGSVHPWTADAGPAHRPWSHLKGEIEGLHPLGEAAEVCQEVLLDARLLVGRSEEEQEARTAFLERGTWAMSCGEPCGLYYDNNSHFNRSEDHQVMQQAGKVSEHDASAALRQVQVHRAGRFCGHIWMVFDRQDSGVLSHAFITRDVWAGAPEVADTLLRLGVNAQLYQASNGNTPRGMNFRWNSAPQAGMQPAEEQALPQYHGLVEAVKELTFTARRQRPVHTGQEEAPVYPVLLMGSHEGGMIGLPSGITLERPEMNTEETAQMAQLLESAGKPYLVIETQGHHEVVQAWIGENSDQPKDGMHLERQLRRRERLVRRGFDAAELDEQTEQMRGLVQLNRLVRVIRWSLSTRAFYPSLMRVTARVRAEPSGLLQRPAVCEVRTQVDNPFAPTVATGFSVSVQATPGKRVFDSTGVSNSTLGHQLGTARTQVVPETVEIKISPAMRSRLGIEEGARLREPAPQPF